jgi:hypothetical protein
MSRAIHLITTGSVYPASHPLLTNLFSEVLPTPEATVARALELADEVAKNTSTVSTKLMRDLMYRGANSAEGAHLLDSRVIFGLFESKDNNEGVKSFFEKRPPNFQGKMPDDAPNAYPWWERVNVASSAKGLKTGLKAVTTSNQALLNTMHQDCSHALVTAANTDKMLYQS